MRFPPRGDKLSEILSQCCVPDRASQLPDDCPEIQSGTLPGSSTSRESGAGDLTTFAVPCVQSFYPAAWMQQSQLSEGRTKADWQDWFARSYAVHFYHTSSHSKQGSLHSVPGAIVDTDLYSDLEED